MVITTSVSTVGTGLTLEVTHEPCTSPLPPGSVVLQLVESPPAQPNTRSTVRTGEHTDEALIELYWQAVPHSATSVGVLAVQETSVLFIGAGTFSAVVDLRTRRVLSEPRVELFWGFSFQRGSVLLRSELDCYMLSPDGSLLGHVPVDPPWQEIPDDEGITFVSPVYGRHRLAWAHTPTGA